jgi:phenylalanyl-tRNA synthetase beta chain
LIPGLLDALRHYSHHQNGDIRLFEIGRVFSGGTNETREERRIALVITGQRQGTFWTGDDREARVDIYDLKGVLERLFEEIGVRGVQWVRADQPQAPYLESASVMIGKQAAGEIGQLNPLIARKYDLRDPVFLAELNLDFILSRRAASKSFKAIPAFPGVRRDVAMIVEDALPHDKVLGVVRQAKPQNLEGVELFDVFRGKNVPSGRKSVAYAFTYRHSERTLTEAEVNAAHEKLVTQLKTQLGAEIRA